MSKLQALIALVLIVSAPSAVVWFMSGGGKVKRTKQEENILVAIACIGLLCLAPVIIHLFGVLKK